MDRLGAVSRALICPSASRNRAQRCLPRPPFPIMCGASDRTASARTAARSPATVRRSALRYVCLARGKERASGVFGRGVDDANGATDG